MPSIILASTISRRSLITKARRIRYSNPNALSNLRLLKIVNRHNSKKLKRILLKKPNDRAEFTNSDLDKAIVLDDLSLEDIKK